MASRFWVGGGSANTWAATGPTNWSDTSGGAGNQSVPGSTDDVFFDGNSGTGNSVISASISIQSLDCTGYTGTLTQNANIVLTITGGSVVCKFVAGMTYTPSTSSVTGITFTGTSGTTSFTTAGKFMPNITVNAPGGTVQMQDAIAGMVDATNMILTLTAGVFDANGHNITVGNFNGSNSNTRTLTLGNGTWTVTRNGGAGAAWSFGTVTNLTFNKGTSNIVFSGTASADVNCSGGGLTYNNLTFADAAAGAHKVHIITGANTFGTLTLGAGTQVHLGANQTVTSLVPVGTQTAPILLRCDTANTSRTVTQTAGTVAGNWLILAGVTGAGGATFNAANSIALGPTTGWNVTAPAGGITPYVIG